jgi:hypothetical protein
VSETTRVRNVGACDKTVYSSSHLCTWVFPNGTLLELQNLSKMLNKTGFLMCAWEKGESDVCIVVCLSQTVGRVGRHWALQIIKKKKEKGTYRFAR